MAMNRRGLFMSMIYSIVLLPYIFSCLYNGFHRDSTVESASDANQSINSLPNDLSYLQSHLRAWYRVQPMIYQAKSNR